MRKFVISPEGFPYIITAIICTCLIGWLNVYASVLPLLVTLFIIYFFRNPPRKIESNEKNILSPADGTILDIKKLEIHDVLGCEAYKISIFLSVFNVHVNRMPLSGKIFYKKYIPGKFFPAFKSHASELNEKNIIGIESGSIKLLVIQITGFIARRIVDWVNIGDDLKQGSLFGLIKFGSCTEIIVPAERVRIGVKIGDKVKGGKTIIGEVTDEADSK